MKRRPVECLYIEDDETDAEMVQKALQLSSNSVRYNLRIITDGEEALRYLSRSEPYKDVPVPDLVLLDLNIPRVHGREVLKKMKESADLKSVPVIVLTTSQAPKDIEGAYEMGANAYLTKPIDFNDYKETFQALHDFWFKKVCLPRNY